jgi:hypothetical protein
MTVVLPKNVDIVVEIFTSGSWSDITSYINSHFEVEQGMIDDSYDTRLADPATVIFTLNNRDEAFPSTVLDKGTLVRCQMTYNDLTVTKFYGFVEDYEPDAGLTGEGKLHITCTDWLAHALNQPVRERAVEVNKKYDDGITLLLSEAPIQPLDTSIEGGVDIFPTIFDQIDNNTSLYREMNNLLMSEYGYGYMDRGGERLKFENRNARGYMSSISQLPSTTGEYLKKVDGSYLLKMDGGKLLLSATQDADFDTTIDPIRIADLRVLRGKHVLNEVEFTAYPKTLDDSLVVVYSMPTETPIFVPATSTIEFEVYFSDPRFGGRIGAYNFTNPVATTDYLANSLSTGAGSNLTSYITVTPTYYADRVRFSIYNAGVGAWITFLRLRGYGIYPDNPISVVKYDQSSKDAYGVRSLSIKQPYQQSLLQGNNEAERVLDQEKDSRNVATLLSYVANASDFNMLAFIHLDIGSLIHVKTTKPAIDSNFYINGMKWKVDWETGYIHCTYILKESPPFEQIALDYNPAAGSKQGIDFGLPSVLANISQTTYFFRINSKNALAQFTPAFGKYSGVFQKVLAISSGKVRWIHGFTSSYGVWETNSAVLNSYVDEWTTVAVTYSNASVANDPIVYVNGAAVAITESGTPAGTPAVEDEVKFIIHNSSYPGAYFVYNGDFVAKDYRIYNRILNATEIAALDANDDPDYGVDSSLIFQFPFIRKFKEAQFIDQALSTDDKVFDRINLLAGTVTQVNPIYGRDPADASY